MKFFLRNTKNKFSKTKSHSQKGGWLLFLCASFLLGTIFSCGSMRDFNEVDVMSYAGNYPQAYEVLESQKESLYNNTDLVLYSLDSGMLARYAKNYEESNNSLSDAEKLIEKYYAISISQTIGAYLLNDNVTDYAGEDFEDIYTNLFMALNYIQLGNTEAAFVEIRRFNNKLQRLSTKYTALLEQARRETYEQGYDAEEIFGNNQDYDDIEFYDSAFARYVSLLLYRSIGRMDSAGIDKKFIQTAFETQSKLYPFTIPSAVEEEFTIPNDKERLNVFCYTGLAPEKHEEVLRLPGVMGTTSFKLALPIMIKNSSSIASIQIKAVDKNNSVHYGNLERMESVENIAIDTFQQRQGVIYLRALLRSISKTTTNAVVTSALQENASFGLAALFNMSANIFTEFSEQADIRSSRYFPALIWVGGINLDEGLYDVTISCYDGFNNVVYEQITENVIIQSGNVNLVEAVCLE